MIQFESIEWVLKGVLKKRVVFENGNYLWSIELLEVSKVSDTNPVVFRLRDMKDEDILGGVYEYELKKIKKNGMHKIEKILSS